jgi:hypothetical protein
MSLKKIKAVDRALGYAKLSCDRSGIHGIVSAYIAPHMVPKLKAK